MTTGPSLDLSALPESASRARRHVAAAIEDDPELSEIAVLLVSELVANAVLHAGTPCVVRVEVRDEDPRLPTVKDYGPDAVTGRGLHIIEWLSDRWGVDGDERGKTVWFELDRPSREGA